MIFVKGAQLFKFCGANLQSTNHRRKKISFQLQMQIYSELQALSAKRHRPPPSSADIEVTEAEPSRTPEDSVCSIEGGELSGISVSK